MKVREADFWFPVVHLRSLEVAILTTSKKLNTVKN